ncbi:cell division protein FtsL [Litchfieldia alkalitelluris]|uniref:cell division protein FtsL n=1 Tax=Litchfieldia alkalitelluris TaxID=304268 RepID=UPI000996BCB0|nr:cell division protein FtsL [Litchfieldia alkalitelluris]
MSNLAYKTKVSQQPEETTQTQTKVAIRKKNKITLGEKILATIFVCAMLIGSIQIVSNQVAIYNANIDIQKMESSILDQEKVIGDLSFQAQELSRPERIWSIAKEMGMDFGEDNVKVIGD